KYVGVNGDLNALLHESRSIQQTRIRVWREDRLRTPPPLEILAKLGRREIVGDGVRDTVVHRRNLERELPARPECAREARDQSSMIVNPVKGSVRRDDIVLA